MLALYKETAVRAFKLAVKAWPVAFSVLLYGVIYLVGARLLLPLGLVGGLLLGLVSAACASGYLYLISQAVSGSRILWGDFKRSFGALFWDVISVFFALWLLSFGVTILARGAGPNADAIFAMAGLAMAFFFNVVPELIYNGRARSFQLLMESGRFVMANPFAWFFPNLLFALVLLIPTGALNVTHPGEALLALSGIFSARGIAARTLALPYWLWPVMLLFLHYVMVFRGVLFHALSTSNPRQRAWQARLRG